MHMARQQGPQRIHLDVYTCSDTGNRLTITTTVESYCLEKCMNNDIVCMELDSLVHAELRYDLSVLRARIG